MLCDMWSFDDVQDLHSLPLNHFCYKSTQFCFDRLLHFPHYLSKCMSMRGLSMNETAAALRPFIFCVHPDLFGRHPKEQVCFVLCYIQPLKLICVSVNTWKTMYLDEVHTDLQFNCLIFTK